MTQLQHPQENSDRQIIARIVGEPATPENLAEIARLSIRYQNFPGAKEIHTLLNKIMEEWGMTPETLFVETRELYSKGKLGRDHLNSEQIQDWS
jgi:hypothetical protein